MGDKLSRSIDTTFVNPDVAPDYTKQPTFDPLLGFPNGRKERVMIATAEEMELAKVPLEHRGYCAHLYIDWRRCMKNHKWTPSNCNAELGLYHNCRHDDFILRAKEYERERRLKMREKRRNARQLQEAM